MCSVWCLFVNGKEFVSLSRFFAVFFSLFTRFPQLSDSTKRTWMLCAHAHSHFLTPFSNSNSGRFYVRLIVFANGSMVIISLTQSQRLKSIKKNPQYYPKQCESIHTQKNNDDKQLMVAMSAKLIFELKRNQFTTAFNRFLLNTSAFASHRWHTCIWAFAFDFGAWCSRVQCQRLMIKSMLQNRTKTIRWRERERERGRKKKRSQQYSATRSRC